LKPALIPYNKGGLKAVTLGISGIARKTTNIFSTVRTSLLFKKKSSTSSSSSSATNSRSGSMDISRKSLDSSTSGKRQQNSSASLTVSDSPIETSSSLPFEELSGAEKLKSLNSTGRVDYRLQEGVLDVSYIIAITVHLNYWHDTDVAYFILREIYGNIYDDEEDV